MKFTKMHGCGNDFIVLNSFNNEISLSKDEVKKMCSRTYGIGADGILLISKSNVADVKMEIINSDGTKAEMCGNGIRCIAKFAYNNKIIDKEIFTIETGAGIKMVELIFNDKECTGVKVNMGSPVFLENPAKDEYDLYCVSVGNPHAGMIVNDFDDNIVKILGPKIENHKGFVNKTSVEFVKIKDKENVEMRVWERGCGETAACGTGACATVSVLNHIGLINNHCNVKMLGGDLSIDIIDNNIFMAGEAIKVFEGEVEI